MSVAKVRCQLSKPNRVGPLTIDRGNPLQWGPCPPLGREAATCRTLRSEQRSFAYHPGTLSTKAAGVAIPRPMRPLHRPLSARLAHGTREHGIIEHRADGDHRFLGLAPCHQYSQFAHAIRIPECHRCTSRRPALHTPALRTSAAPMAHSRPMETP
jgi:hypothetical protein